MTALADVQKFIDASRTVKSPAELQALVEGITREMGFDYFALVHHVDMARLQENGIVALSNYPELWIERYIQRNMAIDDPIHLASHRTNVGFRWDDVPSLIKVTQGHRQTTSDTRKAGISDGYTVPAHVPGEANGSCSFAVATGHSLPEANLPMAQLVGSFAFQAARNMVLQSGIELFRPIKLTQRQLECVLLIGQGKTDWEIGRILGLSEDTVTEYVDDARRRYGVSKRIQLVIRALSDGKLAITDLLQ